MIQVRNSNNTWLFFTIYGNPKINERKLLWNNLVQISSLHNLPWCILGDFNDIIFNYEKFRGRPINFNRAQLLKNCLDSYGMLDLGFNEPP